MRNRALAILLILVVLPPAFSFSTAAQSGRNRPKKNQTSTPSSKETIPKQTDSQPNKSIPPAPSTNAPANTPADDKVVDIGDDDVLKIDATLIDVPVVVSNRNNQYIPTLTRKDFVIYEDGVQQEISFFASQEVPFHVALLLDTSGSTRDSLPDIQAAALEFVNQLRYDDRVMVIAFDSEVEVLCEFTSDRDRLRHAIYSARTGGSTKLYEAVYLAISERLKSIKGRKAIVLLTDGEDTASKSVTYQEAVDIVAESDTLVYAISYPSSELGPSNPYPSPYPNPNPPGRSPWPFPTPLPIPIPPPRDRYPRDRHPEPRDRRPWPVSENWAAAPQVKDPMTSRKLSTKRFLEDITQNSGGDLYFANSIRDLPAVLGTIAAELRHVYLLGYYPSNAITNGKYRRIKVRVPEHGDLIVRHKFGYDPNKHLAASQKQHKNNLLESNPHLPR